MHIRLDDLTGSDIIRLLREHLQGVAQYSPPESIHALDLDGLRRPEITFWSVWHDGELMGCGALKELDRRHGEIKSMRTSAAHLRKGVAARLMQHILEQAERRGYEHVSVETCSMEGFAPAHRLYARFGFVMCRPFADYVEDPNSTFMTRAIRATMST